MMAEQLRRATERVDVKYASWRKRHINKLKTQLHSILDPQLKPIAIN
jgi:hypothetical protein